MYNRKQNCSRITQQIEHVVSTYTLMRGLPYMMACLDQLLYSGQVNIGLSRATVIHISHHMYTLSLIGVKLRQVTRIMFDADDAVVVCVWERLIESIAPHFLSSSALYAHTQGRAKYMIKKTLSQVRVKTILCYNLFCHFVSKILKKKFHYNYSFEF